MDGSPERATTCEASQPFAELDHAVLGVRIEPVDEVGDHDLEPDEILGVGVEGAVGEALDHDDHEFMIVDFEGDVDGAGMVFVAQNERERFVDGEAKVVDGPNRQSFAASNRGHTDTCEAHEPHR